MLLAALDATDTVTVAGGAVVERPNWTARLKAAEMIRDTIDGRPAQVEIKERRSIKIDSEEALLKMARKSPAYRRTLENVLIGAIGGRNVREAEAVDTGPSAARKAAEEEAGSGRSGARSGASGGAESRTKNPGSESVDWELD